MKKKLLSLALALAMCLSLTVPAMAALSEEEIREQAEELAPYLPDMTVEQIIEILSREVTPEQDKAFQDALDEMMDSALADLHIYQNSYIRITNVAEVGELDPYYGQHITCSGPTEITLLQPIENFGASRSLGLDEYEDIPLSNAPTYVGYSGKTIMDVGACVMLTEPGRYSVYTTGEQRDTLKEAPPPSHNLGSGVYGAYLIIIPASSDVQTPTVPVEDIPASSTAYASTQTVAVDGEAVEFQMYALKDENGNDTNYIKLRDMAYILNGTDAQFSVGYDGTISLTTGEAYQAAGTEMTTPYSGDRAYTGGAQTVKINGQDVSMTAITLTDDNGGGYTYFKLRDLGAALGFNVGWSAQAGVFVESDQPYAG